MTEKKMQSTQNIEKTARLTPSELLPPKLTVPLPRQHSNPTISRLIAESMSKPQSPITPSPAGAAQVRSILQRLEQIEVESRDLLTRLFSLVQTDARLERYIRKRLQDPSVSGMWELVEQILASQEGQVLDIEKMLSEDSSDDRTSNCSSVSVSLSSVSVDVKGLKVSDENGTDDGMVNERFKVRQFDIEEVVLAQPLQTGVSAEPVKSVAANRT